MAADCERLALAIRRVSTVFTKAAAMRQRWRAKQRAKERSSSSPAAATAQFRKSRTEFCRPAKTSNSASYPAALAATSDERSRSQRRVAPRRECCVRVGRVRIDVGRVSFVDHNGAEAMRYFVGVASCGMSTKVIERVKAGARLAARQHAEMARRAHLVACVVAANSNAD